MLKTVEEVSPTKRRLVIEIPPEEIEREIAGELSRLKERTRLPGFRPGKAPMGLIEKKFGKDVEGEVLQKLIPKHYSQSLTEAGLKPVANPVFEDSGQFKRNEPFSMTLLVEVMPKIEGLSYEGIPIKDVEITVTDKEIEDIIAGLREDRAVFEPTEEPLSEGDLAVMDYEVPEENQKHEGQVYKLGSPGMPEEFSKGLIGKKKGDVFDLKVKFPEGYEDKEAAGKELTFHISLKDAKKVKLPELDEGFAKELGRTDLADLRGHVKEEIGKSKENALKRMQKAEVMKKLVETYDFPAPESLVERELNQLAEEAVSSGQAANPDEAKEKLRSAAARNVKASLLLDMIGEREKVGVSEEEIRQKVADLSRRLSIAPENIIKYYVSRHGSLESLKNAVYEEKVLDLVLQKAKAEKDEK